MRASPLTVLPLPLSTLSAYATCTRRRHVPARRQRREPPARALRAQPAVGAEPHRGRCGLRLFTPAPGAVGRSGAHGREGPRVTGLHRRRSGSRPSRFRVGDRRATRSTLSGVRRRRTDLRGHRAGGQRSDGGRMPPLADVDAPLVTDRRSRPDWSVAASIPARRPDLLAVAIGGAQGRDRHRPCIETLPCPGSEAPARDLGPPRRVRGASSVLDVVRASQVLAAQACGRGPSASPRSPLHHQHVGLGRPRMPYSVTACARRTRCALSGCRLGDARRRQRLSGRRRHRAAALPHRSGCDRRGRRRSSLPDVPAGSVVSGVPARTSGEPGPGSAAVAPAQVPARRRSVIG